MKSTEYDVPDVTVVNDFTIIYKSQEVVEGQFHDSLVQIKTSKDQFLRKLRFFKSRSNEISQMKSYLIEGNYPKEIFKEFISTLTTNKISLNEENYAFLLKLCEKYEYPELQKQVMKYAESRPDIQSIVEEVLEDDEDVSKEEMIAKHLDICLRNDNMMKFPIEKVIRIVNSPKRVLNDHHLLFEFVKKFILKHEKEADEKDENNYQLLMSSLDYSQMSTDEMKEVFSSKHYSSVFNCRGTKEKMMQFVTEIEKQEEKVNALEARIQKNENEARERFTKESAANELKNKQISEMMKQIEAQEETIHRYEEENQKQAEIIASYGSKIKKIEEFINQRYEEEQEKQEAKMRELEFKIGSKLKEEQESQAAKVKELEDKIKELEESNRKLTGKVTASVEPDQTIKSVISIKEIGSKLDKNQSKCILSTSESQTLGRSEYEAGIQIDKLKQEMSFVTKAGTYFLHALLVDNFGHEKEIVSDAVTTRGVVYNYEFTGRVEAVTLPPGRYKLEVWGAEGGKGENYSKYPGKGGYSFGTLTLDKTTKLFIHVGESPSNMQGGWNGGGSGTMHSSTGSAVGGGGATDISLFGEENSSNWNNANHLYSRIIVAGAGGGSSYYSYPNWYGGFGGGLVGQSSGRCPKEDGGTQMRAGTNTNFSCGQGFGVGGSHTGSGSSGGGSGWYGGGASNERYNCAGGSGGSGYVYNEKTASDYPCGCRLNSSFFLEDSDTVAGDQKMPNPRNGSTETGHSGHGHARITPQ